MTSLARKTLFILAVSAFIMGRSAVAHAQGFIVGADISSLQAADGRIEEYGPLLTF